MVKIHNIHIEVEMLTYGLDSNNIAKKSVIPTSVRHAAKNTLTHGFKIDKK